MRFLKWSIILAVALVILESNVWCPHILKGNELGLVRGSFCCDGSKVPDEGSKTCTSECDGDKYDSCKTGDHPRGCYCMGVTNKCGKTQQGDPCGGDVCGWCTP